MKLKNQFAIWCLCFFVFSLISHGSFAQNGDEDVAKIAGEREANQVVLAIKADTKNSFYIQKALDHIFKLVVYRLNQRGLTKEALRIQGEWNQARVIYFHTGWASLQLGDHPPLSEWLVETYNYIEGLIGSELCEIYHFNDIKFINYGIPVALSPERNPATQKPWGLEEYLAHFVPMVGAVSYWVGVLVCEAALQSVASMFCSASLEISRYGIEGYLAPWVGTEVYKYYNSESMGSAIHLEPLFR